MRWDSTTITVFLILAKSKLQCTWPVYTCTEWVNMAALQRKERGRTRRREVYHGGRCRGE